jgi:hypothetical protein
MRGMGGAGVQGLMGERRTTTRRTRRRGCSASRRRECARCFALGSWRASGDRASWRGRRDRGSFPRARCATTWRIGRPPSRPRPSRCRAKRFLRRTNRSRRGEGGHADGDLGASLRESWSPAGQGRGDPVGVGSAGGSPGGRRGRTARPARDREPRESAGRKAASRARQGEIRPTGGATRPLAEAVRRLSASA